MTIAACYVSSEGVVLGADSTSTVQFAGLPDRHFNHEQKVFEIGEGSTLGITMWGVGGLEAISYRTMIARLADELLSHPANTVLEVAERWNHKFWAEYSRVFAPSIQRYLDLIRISPRSQEEERELLRLRALGGGFCVGGHMLTDRVPQAFQITYDPAMPGPEAPKPIQYDIPTFWGCPNLIYRILLGMDSDNFSGILQSGKWNGTPEDLFAIIHPNMLKVPGALPLRDAIDWVYSSIFMTIKAMKFSRLSPVCGGPIEVAVISSDRRFRWVTHKDLGAALTAVPFWTRRT